MGNPLCVVSTRRAPVAPHRHWSQSPCAGPAPPRPAPSASRARLPHLAAWCLLLVACLGAGPPASAWPARISSVSDGDTIKVLRDGSVVTIRLYGIDAPELDQPFGKAARRCLAALVSHKSVDIEPVTADSYQRIVSVVRLTDGTLVNSHLVEAGCAWVYPRYCRRKCCLEWRELEEAARRASRGLWKDPHPVPPWKWRHTDPHEPVRRR